jgi:hypothetical protein
VWYKGFGNTPDREQYCPDLFAVMPRCSDRDWKNAHFWFEGNRAYGDSGHMAEYSAVYGMSECARRAELGQCSTYRQMSYCSITCGLCKKYDSTRLKWKRYPPYYEVLNDDPLPLCGDLDDPLMHTGDTSAECDLWMRFGKCVDEPETMLQACPVSCELCVMAAGGPDLKKVYCSTLERSLAFVTQKCSYEDNAPLGYAWAPVLPDFTCTENEFVNTKTRCGKGGRVECLATPGVAHEALCNYARLEAKCVNTGGDLRTYTGISATACGELCDDEGVACGVLNIRSAAAYAR